LGDEKKSAGDKENIFNLSSRQIVKVNYNFPAPYEKASEYSFLNSLNFLEQT